jgi:hypothetical protein
MATISFRVADRVDAIRQSQIIKKLQAVAGVQHCGRLDPQSQNAVVSRMCLAEISDSVDVKQVVAQFASTPDVEDVAVESPRYVAH